MWMTCRHGQGAGAGGAGPVSCGAGKPDSFSWLAGDESVSKGLGGAVAFALGVICLIGQRCVDQRCVDQRWVESRLC